MSYPPELIRVENAAPGIYGVAWQTVGGVRIARVHLDYPALTRRTRERLRGCSEFLGVVNEGGDLVWSDYSDEDHGLIVLGPFVDLDSASEELLKECGLLEATLPEEPSQPLADDAAPSEAPACVGSSGAPLVPAFPAWAVDPAYPPRARS